MTTVGSGSTVGRFTADIAAQLLTDGLVPTVTDAVRVAVDTGRTRRVRRRIAGCVSAAGDTHPPHEVVPAMGHNKRRERTGAREFVATSADHIDSYGRSAVHHAATEGRLDDIRTGLKAGIDPDLADKGGFTALHFAAQQGHADAVRLLLQNGAHPDLRNRYGNGPLWTAVYRARHLDDESVRLLLDAGADPDHPNNAGETPRGMARKMGYELP